MSLLFCFLLSIAPSFFSSTVVDPSHVLSDEKRTFFERELLALKKSTGIQLAVYIVPDLYGKTVQDEALRFFSEWQLQHKTHDSTLLFLVAPHEKSAFIDVGYGLDDLLPESAARKICAETVIPLLRQNKPQAAIDAGIRAIYTAFGASFTTEGTTKTRAVYTTTGAFLFLLMIVCLFFIARLAPTRFFFLSPLIGFTVGITQSFGLAVVLAALGGVMVVISYILKYHTPNRLKK